MALILLFVTNFKFILMVMFYYMFLGFKDLFGFHSLKSYLILPGLKLPDSLQIGLWTSCDNFEGKE